MSHLQKSTQVICEHTVGREGRLDVWIRDSEAGRKWAIELLVWSGSAGGHASKVAEHLQHFNKQYKRLEASQYLVVDFRSVRDPPY